MARVIITLLDSFGIGWARDAAAFGDKGSDTLGHIVQWMAENRKNPDGSPRYLALPNLAVMGLETAHWLSTGEDMAHTIGRPVPECRPGKGGLYLRVGGEQGEGHPQRPLGDRRCAGGF